MITVINVPIYTRTVAFLVEISADEFDRFYYNNVTRITDEEYKTIKADILNDNINGTAYYLDSTLMVVYIRNGFITGDVVHEIFHICNKILCDAGVEHNEHAEPWAYLIGWMTGEYYKEYYAESKGRWK